MITNKESHNITNMVNAFNGEGTVYFKHILSKEQLNETGRLFSILTVPPKSSLGFHVHQNESEAYHVLSGEGIYSDNGVEIKISAGDTAYCPYGQGHGIKNETDKDLIIVALIFFNCEK